MNSHIKRKQNATRKKYYYRLLMLNIMTQLSR